jgi:hypothetical protein
VEATAQRALNAIINRFIAASLLVRRVAFKFHSRPLEWSHAGRERWGLANGKNSGSEPAAMHLNCSRAIA